MSSSPSEVPPDVPSDFQCAAASLADAEPQSGTAPIDACWLLVEVPGPWGSDALTGARMPEPVRAYLAGLDGVRVQLIRRPDGARSTGAQVFVVHLDVADPTAPALAWATLLPHLDDVLAVDPHAEPSEHDGWEPVTEPTWFCCTNGSRDRCCALLGRPVTAALAERWPGTTWEVDHLGGHRFAGTLLALPSGLVLGRLDADTAAAAAAEVVEGRWPAGHVRGRAGAPAAVQAALAHVVQRRGLSGPDALTVREVAPDGDAVRVVLDLTEGGSVEQIEVEATSQQVMRRQSCAKPGLKPAAWWTTR
ncbi:sucrase ferredoxin [Nocardioides acrostichi]|uniref:Sucrase ferredoxin n=1 Tax=Nocardioides acrostichi TaxID=2784339 RepID=A0A930Y6T5_9ACTN|nr:sucrase ferredoxin [Nocardioides acrostichi]MBF4161286.1 sucrase ferredoxin [Nocardioides acrostichi]